MKSNFYILLFIFFLIVASRFVPSQRPIHVSSTNVAGGIVPHHLYVKDIIGNFFIALPSDRVDNIIIIGADHAELGESNITFDPSFDDQSMTALTPFITAKYPGIKISKIVLKSAISRAECEALSQQLLDIPGHNLLIASIDFSHYLSSEKAEQNDLEIYDLIVRRDYKTILGLNSDYLDSRGSLVTALMYFDQKGASNMNMLDHTNSGKRGNPYAPTTSYFSILFYAQN